MSGTRPEWVIKNLTGKQVIFLSGEPLEGSSSPARVVTAPDHVWERFSHGGGEVECKLFLPPRQYIIGLPAPERFVFYIVDHDVFAFCSDRTDLLTPSVEAGGFIARHQENTEYIV